MIQKENDNLIEARSRLESMIAILMPLSVVFADLGSVQPPELLGPRSRSGSCQLFGIKQVHQNDDEPVETVSRPRSVSFHFYGENNEAPDDSKMRKYRKLSEGILDLSDSETEKPQETKGEATQREDL